MYKSRNKAFHRSRSKGNTSFIDFIIADRFILLVDEIQVQQFEMPMVADSCDDTCSVSTSTGFVIVVILVDYIISGIVGRKKLAIDN